MSNARERWQTHFQPGEVRHNQIAAFFVVAGHTNAVLGVCQHPSLSNVVLSCGADRMIKEWSLSDGICKRTIPCQSKPLDLAFSSDGQFIVSAHYDGSLHVFDAGTGSELQHIEKVHKKASGPGMAVIATALPFNMVSVGRDSSVCVTDVYHGEVCLVTLCATAAMAFLICRLLEIRIDSRLHGK